MSQITKGKEYEELAMGYFNNWLPGINQTVPTTAKGLSYRATWGVLRFSANTAFAAMVFADHLNFR